jgi:putative OPT family oligopeptide transporter
LVVGVLVGAAVIPPVLDLLNEAYGFAGMPGVDPTRALAAPQAGLISALAQGVIQGNIDWSLIGLGAAIGVALIVLDEMLGRTTRTARLPPLAVGLGIYLPSSTTLMIVVGDIVGWYFDKRAERGANPEGTRQLGVLLASGMIVGESIIGVVIAAIVVFSGKSTPLALVGDGFGTAAIWIGGIAFVLVNAALYRWVARLGRAVA